MALALPLGPLSPQTYNDPAALQDLYNLNSANPTYQGQIADYVNSGGGSVPLNNGGTAPAPDPYAQWGGQAAYNNLISGFNTQKDQVFGSANDAINTTGSQLNRSILDFLDQERLAQKGIDTKATRNELAKLQGVNGILGMVGRGIRSGGVMLANKNAGDSSAAGALAHAYGQLGRQQMANVGNQYALGQQDVQAAQDAFAVQQASGVRNIQGTKNDAINNIVNDARNKFAALDAQIANANLPNRIAIEQEKEKVRQSAINALQQYDSQLNSGIAGIQPLSADQRRANAADLAHQGTDLGADAFNYNTEAPAQFTGTGPWSSALPLFSTKNRLKEQFA